MSSTAADQCELCRSTYSFIKKKKSCAICHQSYCSNCAPRERNQTYRICLVCQRISSESTSESQLLELKVKHLRSYLQAKGIPHHTCTEKQELVNLITKSRDRPFVDLSAQPRATESNNTHTTSTPSSAAAQPSKSDSNTKSFPNLPNSMSSFANQVNAFATNIQDFVTSAVSGALNQTVGDPLQEPTTTASSSNPASSRPSQPSAPQPSARPSATNAQPAAAASTCNQRPRRKSLSEINDEEKIENLNIRELKEILSANFVDYKGCVEKRELLEKVQRLYRDRANAQLRAKELDASTAGDTESCKICMDALADCVFLDCGHMVTCVKCGKLLAECPICRANIVRVVRVFKS